MKRKKYLVNATLGFLAFITLLVSAISVNRSHSSSTRGEFSPYSIVLGTEKNKIAEGSENPDGYTGTGVLTTELGNNIAVSYKHLTNPSTHWQRIKTGGYIVNSDPINGITNLELTKRDDTVNVEILYSNTMSFDASRKVVINASSPTNFSTDFNGYKPKYIGIYALADSSFNLGKIEFDCVDHYHTLSVLSKNDARGTVTSEGLFRAGTNVTVTATALAPYFFAGWFDASNNLVSSSATYTFAMPSNNLVLSADFVAEGEEMKFGAYPQTRVTDVTLITTLNNLAGGSEGLPTAENAKAWTDYLYYYNGAVTSFMWYIDLVNEGEEYRGVYYTEYRYTYTDSTAGCFNQQDHGYTKRIVYWFKYEPITWKVLDIDAGKAFLLAQTVLDAQDYFYAKTRRNIDGETVYANNYEHSHIRSWLNSSFLNAAFTTTEQNKNAVTTVDNSKTTTINNVHNFDCPNTLDKVFLLSYLDLNGHYGFVNDASRVRYPSDYALSQAVSKDYDKAYWWTRSPYSSETSASRVNYNGALAAINVTDAAMGILPAIWINA